MPTESNGRSDEKSTVEYLTLADIHDAGFSLADVRRRCPWATEYTALDGQPCWIAEDLSELLDTERDGDE